MAGTKEARAINSKRKEKSFMVFVALTVVVDSFVLNLKLWQHDSLMFWIRIFYSEQLPSKRVLPFEMTSSVSVWFQLLERI